LRQQVATDLVDGAFGKRSEPDGAVRCGTWMAKFGTFSLRYAKASLAYKNTCMASQRVRKKICVSRIPRHRAATQLATVPTRVTIAKATAETKTNNRLSGEGSAGCSSIDTANSQG